MTKMMAITANEGTVFSPSQHLAHPLLTWTNLLSFASFPLVFRLSSGYDADDDNNEDADDADDTATTLCQPIRLF